MQSHRDTASERRQRTPRPGRTVLILLLVIILLVGAVSVVTISGASGSGDRRNTGATPRYLDIWAVYPDDSVRFAALFHPLEGAGATVEVAGPLVQAEVDVQSVEVTGGALAGTAYLPGPGQDSAYVYPRFTIQRAAADGSQYGLNVLVTGSPYLTVDPANPQQRLLSLGTTPQSYYAQVIVAVALPAGTPVSEFADLQPYRQTQVGGWDVYYFDTTSVPAGSAIRLAYSPQLGGSTPALNPQRIDARR